VFRKDLIPLLLDRPLSVTQISRLVQEPPKDVASDLQHLLRSLKHTGYDVLITPASCRKCKFEFGPEKLQKPSKCPECHSTWLTEPLIQFRTKTDPQQK
jgi:predicted Zn-ribbon and HTH transcriptional regulator